MELLIVGLIWVLNMGISAWNAYACGKVWVEARCGGGWPRFMTWMGAIQSASGFSWCYLILLALFAHYNGVYWPVEVDGKTTWQVMQLPLRETQVALQLGYVLIIPGILLSGLMITVDSWARAWRQRTLGNVGSAAYNTFAQAHNTYHAVTGFMEAFGGVLEYFSKPSKSDSDSKGSAAILLLALVGLAICAGILTTTVIIRTVAASDPLPIPDRRGRNRLEEYGGAFARNGSR